MQNGICFTLSTVSLWYDEQNMFYLGKRNGKMSDFYRKNPISGGLSQFGGEILIFYNMYSFPIIPFIITKKIMYHTLKLDKMKIFIKRGGRQNLTPLKRGAGSNVKFRLLQTLFPILQRSSVPILVLVSKCAAFL